MPNLFGHKFIKGAHDYKDWKIYEDLKSDVMDNSCEAHVWLMLGDIFDHLCGLVVRVPGYRSGDPGSIPSATRFSV
jgi:hypothetical protein